MIDCVVKKLGRQLFEVPVGEMVCARVVRRLMLLWRRGKRWGELPAP
jgi:hypothetical protein